MMRMMIDDPSNDLRHERHWPIQHAGVALARSYQLSKQDTKVTFIQLHTDTLRTNEKRNFNRVVL